ncbi:MAG TPA: peptidoglycan-binding domain-containing protein, partial [Candidatus Paceibacterota bacterium]|nr:peptidoglycan-binding domain-containing protein [Candidatus Paceibacterota bacterium]
MVVAVMLVGVVAVNAPTASAASCTITSTLKVGSKGAQVMCLQTAVGVTADGSFGPKTKAAVMAWQKSVGLTADGVFGAKSRAAWMAGSMGMTFPAGCTSGTGFSPTTGMPCTGTVMTTFPPGCTSASGFSSTTGASCATGAVNNQTGPVQVTLASDNPATGYIIANQATADLAHFTFTGSGTINSVTLQRTGISD